MKVINSLIFNALALRQSINLPQIGSLRVEQHQAKLKGGCLGKPVNRIIYSKNETQGAASIIDIIEQKSGADRAKAEEIYSKWLEEARKDKTITIDGAGRIKNDFFTPVDELASLVNPNNGEMIKMKKRTKWWLIIVVTAVIALCLGVGYNLIIGICNPTEVHVTTYAAPQQELQPVTIDADTTSMDSLTTTSVSDSAAIDTAKPTHNKALAPKAAISTPVKGRYYVIAGVYSIVANSEKFIAKSRAKSSKNITYNIIQISANKFLVSIFDSTDEEQANLQCNSMKDIDPNLWVYSVN